MSMVSSMKPQPPAKQIRWYHPLTGQPCNGAGLREAREEGLLPSVTEIIQPFKHAWSLDLWMKKECARSAITMTRNDNESDDDFVERIVVDARDKEREAARFGTQIHAACEQINLGGPKPRPDSPLLPFIEHYWDWWLKNITHVISSEQVFVNTEAGYAGRCDLEAYISTGEHVVLDIKTQSIKKGKPTFYQPWAMQLAAYGKCKGINKGISLVINSERPEPCYMKVWDNLDEHYTAFEHCLALWCYEKRYWPKKGEK